MLSVTMHSVPVIERHEAIHGLPRCARNDVRMPRYARNDVRMPLCARNGEEMSLPSVPVIARHEAIHGLPRCARNDVGLTRYARNEVRMPRCARMEGWTVQLDSWRYAVESKSMPFSIPANPERTTYQTQKK